MTAMAGATAGLAVFAALGAVATALTLDEWWERRKARQAAKDLWSRRDGL